MFTLIAFFENSKLPAQFVTAKGELKTGVIIMHILSTLALFIGVLIVRWFIARAIRNPENLPTEVRRRWLVALRNATVLVFLLGLVIIWSEEIQTVATYLFAIAVATVISLKELIQCITGSVMRATSGAFKIGDRIEIAGIRGDVISYSMLTTTIMEVGPGELTHRLTGRAISLPNSMFLNKPVVNECFTHDFVLHVFKIPMKIEEDWNQAETDLIQAAKTVSASYMEEAREHFNRLSRKEGLVIMSVDPHITFSIPSAGTVELIVRMAAPTREKGKIEQMVIRQFLMCVRQRALAKAEAQASTNGSQPVST